MSDGARCHYCRKVPCACDTAPQPPPGEREVRQVVLSPMGIAVLDRIAALEAQLAAVQQANVMARDIADQAHQRAEKAERELAEAQERLVMAVEFIGRLHRLVPDPIWISERGYWAASHPDDDMKGYSARELISATAEAVAQHTAEVERRGAAKEWARVADKRNGFPKGIREYAAARLAEVEGA